MPNHYSLDLFYRVYDDQCGTYIQIGTCPDANSLIDIQYVDEAIKSRPQTITMTKEQARLVVDALNKYLEQMPDA